MKDNSINYQHKQTPQIQWNYKQSNPFNSSKNLLFFYSQQHISVISSHICELYHRQGIIFKGLITHEVILQKMQAELDLEKGEEITALYLQHGMWYFYFLRKEKNRKINVQSNKELLYVQGQINSCIFALIHLKNHLCSQTFQSPINMSDLLQIQQQLGSFYLEAVKKNHKFTNWQELLYENKREWLALLHPRSREQFLKVSGFPKSSLDYEVNQLCNTAIDQGDYEMVKLLLQSGFRLKSLRSLTGELLDIYALIKKAKQEKPNKEDEYAKIEKSLNFYGVSTNSEVQHKAILLKKAQMDATIKNLADRLRRPKEIFESFFLLLQKAIIGTLNTLQLIASGRFSVYEDNSTKSIIDSIVSAIFEKVPAIGSSLASKYNGFRNDQRIEFGKRIVRKMPIDSKEIVADFSIRVVETYCQKITDTEEMSIIAELKEYFRKKISKIFKYNEKQFVFDGQNFTLSWMILSAQFVGMFINFLSSEEANESPSTLGIRAAFHSFGYHKVGEQQFSKLILSTTYEPQNALIMCKLTSYIRDISKYPNSLNSFGTVYWSDTKLQPEKIRVKAESAIIVTDIFALFIFNSSSTVNLEKKKTKKCSKITISQDLCEQFQQFLDLASFKESKDNKSWSLTKLLDSVTKKKGLKIILVGYKLGAVIASLLHCVLAEDYQYSVDSIISYNFDIPLWCHKSSLSQVFEKLKYFYSVFVIVFEENKNRQKSDYSEIGKRFYLKGQQKQSNNGLQQYIFLFENQQIKNISIRKKSNSDRKKVEEKQDNDKDIQVISTESRQYYEGQIMQSIRSYNFHYFKNLINLCNVTNKQKLNNFLSEAINIYPSTQLNDYQDLKRESFKFIKYLIQKKNCDPNQLDSSSRSILESNQTHLQYALHWGYFQLSKYLIQKGGDLNKTFRKGVNNYNSLSLAIQSGCVQLVKYLIEEKKMRMDNLWLQGRTGHVGKQIIYILIRNGADPNTSTRVLGHTMFSILNMALQTNDINLIKLLLEKGADPNLIVHVSTAVSAGSAVQAAAIYASNLRVLKLLLEYGGNINLQFTSIVKLQNKWNYNRTALNYLKEQISYYNKQPKFYEVGDYLNILKMQGHIANEFFEEKEYNQTVEFLLQQDFVLHSISTYYVSQFLYTEGLFNRKAATKKQDKYRKHLDTVRKFMFEGSSKIQRYNTAVRYLYSFHDPKRHEQALKICNQSPSDEDFIFLKAVTYLQLLGPSNDSAKNAFLLQKIEILKNQIQKPQLALFIQGQIYYFKGEIDEAIYQFKQSQSSNKYFLHPQLKLLKILHEKDDSTKLFKENYKCRILPIQLASIMEDIQDIIKTDQFLSKNKFTQEGIDNRLSSLQRSLKTIFSVNPIIIRDRLSDLIPQKVFKMSLTINSNKKAKQTNFTLKGLLKSIDYAYSLLKTQKSNALVQIFSKKQEPPSSKQSTFFQGITEVVKKLVVLRQTIQNKCSQNRDFKNPKDYEICLGNISDLIEYYESYILRVIHNYNKDRDGNYQKFFYEKIGKALDIKRDVIIYGQRNFLEGKSLSSAQPYSIMRQEAQRLTASSLESDQMYGTHTVILLPVNSPNQIYFKHKPYAPGIQYAVNCLYKLILPNTTPQTTLIKVVKDKEESIFLASAAITGRNFAQVINQTQVINTIDIKNFSSLFLCSFLVCTGDSKPDNFVLHFNYDSNEFISTELVSVDNDIAFYRRGLKINEPSRKIYSDMLNVLYLLPQMAMPVSPYLKQFLSQKENQPQIIVAKWLGGLYEKNRIYQRMKGFTADDLKTLKLPIKLPRGTAAKVYSILKKIRCLISHQGVTHAEIFQHLSPSLAYFYNKYRDTSSTVNSLKNLYMAAGADPNIVNSLYSLDKSINSKAWNTLSSAKRKEEGSFNSLFNSSIREEAEIFIEVIDFRAINDSVLEAICKQLPFVENLSLTYATQVQACKIVDSSTNGIKNLRMKQFLSAGLSRQHDISQANMAQEILPIESIFDILNLPKIPNRQSIVRTLLSKKLNVNDQNSNGQTILFETASLICSNRISLSEGEKLLNSLLDCGANPNIGNKNSLKLIELEAVQRNYPQIIIIVLGHQPTFFKKLLRQGKIQEAEMIAESSSMNLFLSTIQEDGDANDEGSALREVFKDRKYRHLAQILISKLQEDCNSYEQDLVYIFVQNYLDEDVGLLQNFLKKKRQKASVLLNYLSYFGYYPADIAYRKRKITLLTVILNLGGGMGLWHQQNIQLAHKASQFGIKLDINDVSHKYDHKKVNREGLTVLELMAKQRDPDILAYLDLAQLYKEQLRKIALSNNFFELIEALFTEQELAEGLSEKGHPLAKSEATKELSKLLAKHGFGTTLQQALTQIDLLSKFDSEGNTVLLSIGLKYHQAASEISRQEFLQQIKLILGKFGKGLLQVTMRDDGNTLLHLAVQWGDYRLAGLLLNAAKQSCERVLLNAQLLTPDELAQDQELGTMVKIQKVSKADAMQIKRSDFNHSVQSKCISFGLGDL